MSLFLGKEPLTAKIRALHDRKARELDSHARIGPVILRRRKEDDP